MMSDYSRQGAKMFGNFWIALLRHGDAADRTVSKAFTYFADLRPLQIDNFLADPTPLEVIMTSKFSPSA
jgi:hypothetical protein